MVTIKINVNTQQNASLLTHLLQNLQFVESIENVESEEDDVIKRNILNEPSELYGTWEKKDISDIKAFRNQLWQRKS